MNRGKDYLCRVRYCEFDLDPEGFVASCSRIRLSRYHFERRPRRLVYRSFGRAERMPARSN
jgi:hypothetical protein